MKILTDDGTIRVGWATPTLPAYQTLGTDEGAYCFDGYLVGGLREVPFEAHLLWCVAVLRAPSGISTQITLGSAGKLVISCAAWLTWT